MRGRGRLLAAACALVLAAWSASAEELVLKSGQRFQVERLERRGDKVRAQTAKGDVFEVPADQVASPPLERIPSADAPAAAGLTLVLKTGQRFAVERLERSGAKVRARTTKGDVFEVAADQVASPALSQIPAAAPPAVAGATTLVLKDGRRFQVTRLEGRGDKVRAQSTTGEVFEVTADQIVSPPLDQIPGLQAPVPVPAPTPAPEPTPEATPAPPVVPPTTPLQPGNVPDFVPMPNRWQIAYPPYPGRNAPVGHLADPYNQNVLKGDRPIAGNALFLVLTGTLDTPAESRKLPIGSGVSAANPAAAEFFGDGGQLFTTPRAALSVELFKGQTAFRPKTWALKATAVANLNYLRLRENNNVDVDVREGKTRRRQDFALEEAFGEVKLADLSANFDAVSLRAGIQPFVSDFRGFVFGDVNLGVRLFGNLVNNRWQYNAAAFDLLEKETNSELNTLEKRDQKVYVANVFRQDFLKHGYTLSLAVLHSQDDGTRHFDENGFLVRPAKIGSVRAHAVSSTYVGWSGDGHLGRTNLSHALYYVFGSDDDNALAGAKNDVGASFAALELSRDRDFVRLRLSGVFASGDDDASDGKASGFDAIYDNSNFAGGAFSFWSRSGIALTQTGVLLKAPGSLLPSLRSSKFEGQQSFVNPGLLLAGAGLDLDLTPKLRVVANANYLRFQKTGALELLLFQPGIRKTIGWDLGTGFVYRPLLNENVVVTGGLTALVAGPAFDDIFSSACSAPGCGAQSHNLRNFFLNVKLTY